MVRPQSLSRFIQRNRFLRPALGFLLAAVAVSVSAATIGVNQPAKSITRERIALLPAVDRSAWLAYIDRSERQRRADKDAFQAELRAAGVASPVEPPHGYSARGIPLDRDPAWYSSPAARHIANVVLSYQTPAGGWSKNLDMSRALRSPGEKFAPDNLSLFLSPDDFDKPAEPDWNYVGTIDNDATTTQLRFLAKVAAATGTTEGAQYRRGFLRGIDYLFAAQFPNGGWPQVWPLEGGYHDAVTYNDDAVTQVLELLQRTSTGRDEFSFVPKNIRAQAAARFARGIQCILQTQIVTGGMRTVWSQQVDALTLKPVSGRNYELAVPCASESAGILLLLMNDLPHPTVAEQRSIRAAAAWFKQTAIYGKRWQRTPNGRELVDSPGAGPIWARYYSMGTNHPLFGDRDKSIHDNVNELSLERRNGYAWYSAEPQAALDRYAQWSAAFPESKNVKD